MDRDFSPVSRWVVRRKVYSRLTRFRSNDPRFISVSVSFSFFLFWNDVGYDSACGTVSNDFSLIHNGTIKVINAYRVSLIRGVARKTDRHRERERERKRERERERESALKNKRKIRTPFARGDVCSTNGEREISYQNISVSDVVRKDCASFGERTSDFCLRLRHFFFYRFHPTSNERCPAYRRFFFVSFTERTHIYASLMYHD